MGTMTSEKSITCSRCGCVTMLGVELYCSEPCNTRFGTCSNAACAIHVFKSFQQHTSAVKHRPNSTNVFAMLHGVPLWLARIVRSVFAAVQAYYR